MSIKVTDHSQIAELIDHLFRYESGKLVAVLTRIFGTHNLELAEDVVQDSLLKAMNIWTYKGVPQNPVAWLHTVAKNKALNIINREKYKKDYAIEAAHFLKSEWTATSALDHLFSEKEIFDDQLRMMFTCCHPAISPDSQIALTLKTLCGFSIPEIASAYLTTHDTINKRLVRARQNIRDAVIPFIVPHDGDLEKRLDSILEVIYLLFNEGYSASIGEDLIRQDLCTEAIRLAELLTAHNELNKHSKIKALVALMYLNASRFPARQDKKGNIIPMAEQDRTLWNKPLMDKGFVYLEQSTSDGKLSKYHILAAISANHCSAVNYASTDWENILRLYDHLLYFDSSPIVVLNRAVAVSNIKGTKTAIDELKKMESEPVFKSYHLYYSTLAELYKEQKSFDEAIRSIHKALALSATKPEKDLLEKRLEWCNKQLS